MRTNWSTTSMASLKFNKTVPWKSSTYTTLVIVREIMLFVHSKCQIAHKNNPQLNLCVTISEYASLKITVYFRTQNIDKTLFVKGNCKCNFWRMHHHRHNKPGKNQSITQGGTWNTPSRNFPQIQHFKQTSYLHYENIFNIMPNKNVTSKITNLSMIPCNHHPQVWMDR